MTDSQSWAAEQIQTFSSEGKMKELLRFRDEGDDLYVVSHHGGYLLFTAPDFENNQNELPSLTPDNSRALLPLLAYHAQHETMEGYQPASEWKKLCESVVNDDAVLHAPNFQPPLPWPLNGEWGDVGQRPDREGVWEFQDWEIRHVKMHEGELWTFDNRGCNGAYVNLNSRASTYDDDQCRYLGALPTAQAPTPAYGAPPTCEGEYRMEWEHASPNEGVPVVMRNGEPMMKDTDGSWGKCSWFKNARWIRTGDLPAEAPAEAGTDFERMDDDIEAGAWPSGPDAAYVRKRVCKLVSRAWSHIDRNGDTASDCFCGMGGFWKQGEKNLTRESGYRNDGKAVLWLEKLVANALTPVSAVDSSPQDPPNLGEPGVRPTRESKACESETLCDLPSGYVVSSISAKRIPGNESRWVVTATLCHRALSPFVVVAGVDVEVGK